MKSVLINFILLFACALGAGLSYGQEPIGAGPKRARTPEDYKVRTLTEIAAASAAETHNNQDAEVLLGDLFPSRVRVVYKGSARPLPQNKRNVILSWARKYAGDPFHYTGPYQNEMQFGAEGKDHWLVINEHLVPRVRTELKKGIPIDLYLIRLGGIRTKGKWEWVLLVESFAKP